MTTEPCADKAGEPLGLAAERPVRPGSEASGLVQRLRVRTLVQHGGPRGMDYGWNLQEHDSELHRDAADELERLAAALALANSQAERFERGWYLRGDALEKLQNWADAYPLTVFPEPDFAKAHALLLAGGMTLDAISASNMRHVIKGVREIVDEGLRA